MRSDVKSPVRSDVKSPVRSDVKSPVRSHVKSPVRSHVKSPVRSHVKSPVRSHVKSLERSNVKSPERSNAKRLLIGSNEYIKIKERTNLFHCVKILERARLFQLRLAQAKFARIYYYICELKLLSERLICLNLYEVLFIMFVSTYLLRYSILVTSIYLGH